MNIWDLDGLGELLFVQAIFLAVLFFLIKAAHKRGKRLFPYLIVAGLYVLMLVWLVGETITMKSEGEGGLWFAIGMYSMIIPGILTIAALIAYRVSSGRQNGG